MSACVLHMGMMKTGTSSIQKSLKGFTDSSFVWYEDRKGRANHSPAIFGIVGAVKPSRKRRRIEPEFEAPQRVDRAIRSLGGRSLVMSGEGMRLLASPQIQELAAYFRSRVAKLTVVGYVRPPVGFRTSLAHATMGGKLTSLTLGNKSTGYRDTFEKFDNVLGRENVLLWKFDPKSFPAGCVVQDFCARLGIDFPAERIVRANESLSREAVALLYTYRKFGAELGSKTMGNPQRLELVQRLAGIGRTKFRFSPDLVRPFLERNRADIEWMERRLGQSLDEDWREHRPDDVREDWDLLRPDPKVVAQLREMLGDAAPAGVKGETPEEVAVLVHALRDEPRSRPRVGWDQAKHAPAVKPRARGREGNGQPKGVDLIEQMQQTQPELLNGISPQKARLLASNIFKHIQDNLAHMDDGTVSYAGLGSFRVRKVGQDQNGVNAVRTHIRFRPAHQTTN
jgi:hypothetical protein